MAMKRDLSDAKYSHETVKERDFDGDQHTIGVFLLRYLTPTQD
jgi:hypothetical protein